jgi:hypothetical protein
MQKRKGVKGRCEDEGEARRSKGSVGTSKNVMMLRRNHYLF